MYDSCAGVKYLRQIHAEESVQNFTASNPVRLQLPRYLMLSEPEMLILSVSSKCKTQPGHSENQNSRHKNHIKLQHFSLSCLRFLPPSFCGKLNSSQKQCSRVIFLQKHTY